MLEKQGIESIRQKKDEEFAQRVAKKYEQKPMIRLLRIRTRNCRIITYPFQLISLLSLVVFVLWFCKDYSGAPYWGILSFLTLIAVAWEIGKRVLIIETFDGAWNANRKWKLIFIPFVLVLIAGSFAGSYKGGDEFMKSQTSPPLLVHNPEIDSLKALIEDKKNNIKLHQKQTWKGRIVGDSNGTIAVNEKSIAALEQRVFALEDADRIDNNQIELDHEAKKASLGAVLGSIAGSMDFLLLLLLAFAEHFETEADKLIKSASSADPDQSNVNYEHITSATQIAASQPVSKNRRQIRFDIPEGGFTSTQKKVTQADTQMTQNAESTVARETQPDTENDTFILAPPQKDPDYIVKMKKRIRERWAKSFENHPRARKSEAGRKHLRELAMEEWKELEEMGYLIQKDTSMNPWGLEIVSPQKRKRHGLT